MTRYTYTHSYESFDALLSQVPTAKALKEILPGSKSLSLCAGERYWFGNLTLTQAIKELTQGSGMFAAEISAAKDRLETALGAVIGNRNVDTYDPSCDGIVLDCATAATGNPECWLTETTLQAAGCRAIDIVAEASMQGRVSGGDILRRGAAIVALLELLEQRRIATTVTGSWCHTDRDSPDTSLVTFPLRLAGEPLDTARLSFCLCHPAFNRRVRFGLTDTIPAWRAIAGLDVGYGQTRSPDQAAFPAGSIIVPAAGAEQWRNDTAAVAWMVTAINGTGVAA